MIKSELKQLLKEKGLNTKGLKSELWERVCKTGLIEATVKPDLDNVSKSILDALNEIAYKDDSQVISLWITKERSFNPRVEVEINSYEKDIPQNNYL